ncbi:prepilin-type N-terminal cleavage/methylation domain-containing protein [Hyphomicrobium sp.]|uniref:prepilin-type N-terminal cleavage/methylation domain-containing protein n=1 Tax=Hyphomicrobium sp. TaxID=82 RepID=UPI002E32DC5D|nr:prepilin-type N-terminal cleavage/methylation domain-containing protein [Hyphomicrobium sp.]HEX2841008.1 prepilin-type N-terminal cleavage/methylation domain-containing protein [Hyphomicrobium sp.]
MRSGEAGFSLIETLVALAILAFLLAMVPTAFKHAKRALKGLMDHASSAESGSLRYLEQRLADALPLYSDRKGHSSRIAFRGERHGIEFLTPIENTPLGGGLYRISVSAEPSRLSMRLMPYRPLGDSPTQDAVQRDLIRDLSQGEFRYFGSDEPGTAEAWHETWVDRGNLPLLIEITLKERTARSATVIRIAPKNGRSGLFGAVSPENH